LIFFPDASASVPKRKAKDMAQSSSRTVVKKSHIAATSLATAFDNEDCHPKHLCDEGSSSKELQPSSVSAILQVDPIPEKKAYYGSLVHDFKPEFEKQAYSESPFSHAPPGNEALASLFLEDEHGALIR
jgi:hypothetical protein